MTTQLVGKNCDGGHYTCSPPKECCKQGCCYLKAPSVYHPPTVQSGNFFNPLFIGHWYFWLAITATIAGILCACSLWRRHSNSILCCRNSGRDDRASEPDSNGSCYIPPQYSRCNSFYQAPPPYSEVTSKPDLYPLVISYNGENVIKNNNSSTGYLMVQYFRNFIIRPVGSLSATSTIDSLSSSFICNATNEANTIIPPPYSCMGSLEEVTTDLQYDPNRSALPRSASLLSNPDYHQLLRQSSSVHSNISDLITSTIITTTTAPSTATSNRPTVVSIRNNPCFCQTTPTTNIVNNNSTTNNNNNNSHNNTIATVPKNELEQSIAANNNKIVIESKSQQTNCDSAYKTTNKKLKSTKILHSQDSESQDDEHNFSDLLNLSVCVPSSVTNLGTTTIQSNQLQELHYNSVTNSMTGSDISSLANLGTPDSPPRATSPTVEMKELLDKIQQLPQHIQLNQSTEIRQPNNSKSYFHRNKAKTLYMPLNEASGSNMNKSKSSQKIFTKSWLSRSAPNTPCTNFVPSFPIGYKKGGSSNSSHKNSRIKLTDGSPLLRQHDESEEDLHKDECL